MPYINKFKRTDFDKGISELFTVFAYKYISGVRDGEVTYVIFSLLKKLYSDGDYQQRIRALAVLESTKLEYYRRFLVPLEDEKIKENGDVT